jgi:hypothetical protein
MRSDKNEAEIVLPSNCFCRVDENITWIKSSEKLNNQGEEARAFIQILTSKQKVWFAQRQKVKNVNSLK